MNLAKLACASLVASLAATAAPARAEEATLTVNGTTLLKVSRTQLTRPDAYGIYERSLELLGPADGSVEMGSSRLYGALYLRGDAHRASLGIGPGLVLSSSFPLPSDNRNFYILLGDQHNVAAGKGDVVFESWDSTFTNHLLHMVMKPNGNIGIGLTDPAYRLQVAGVAAATGWVNLSSRDFKEDIQRVDAAEQQALLDTLMKVDVARYTYKKAVDSSGRRRIGFVAEELPAEVLSADGKGVDVYELLAVAIGAMKAQQQQIQELERKVTSLSPPAPTP